MEKKRYLIIFLLSFLLGMGVFFWAKKEVLKESKQTLKPLEMDQNIENGEKKGEANEPAISKEPTKTTSTIGTSPPKDIGDKRDFESPTGSLPKNQNIASPGRVIPPPTHPSYQPSSQDPQKTIEAFLQAAVEGNPENFQYFLSFEARNNSKIHLVPGGWSGELGMAVTKEQVKGDANTVKIIVAFYKGKSEISGLLEKIGYFLGQSFGKWLIFDTVVES